MNSSIMLAIEKYGARWGESTKEYMYLEYYGFKACCL